MSDVAISQMRIFELRSKLKDKGLSSSGTKAELIARLTQYYAENSAEVTDRKVDNPPEPENREPEESSSDFKASYS